MSLPARLKDLPPVKRIPLVAVISMVVIAPLAAVGWLGAANNAGDDALMFGLVFCGMGVLMATFAGSYNRFTQMLFFPLGVFIACVGFGFAGGGLTKLIVPNPTYLAVWGLELLVLAGLVGLYGWILHLLVGHLIKNQHVRAKANPKKLQEYTKERNMILPMALAICGCGLLLFLVGLVVGLLA